MSGRNAVHFGAGNIGRGFIGEVLFRNGFHIDFVDINETIINALHERGSYEIELAGKTKDYLTVTGVDGINSKTDGGKVIDAIVKADIVTTAIGPGVLPHIAKLIAQGLEARKEKNPDAPLDIIACENMIGGSSFLKAETQKHLAAESRDYVRNCIGFPDAAVDRIVPIQHHEDPLAVTVEPFKEWIVSEKDRKLVNVTLDGVVYVENLEPYIERKLFSVNTGHATVAYAGMRRGHKTIEEAVADTEILRRLRQILGETGSLLIAKWAFDKAAHEAYIEKIISRFENPNNPDTCSRVARDPIRKLGFNERFIRPVRELKERGLPYPTLIGTSAIVLAHTDAHDPESVRLESMRSGRDINGIKALIAEITGLSDNSLITEIADAYELLGG
ncbi:MAG: mannitol-1-phosphate 5-dehydrogenase [Spirochaetaceae bacterium]|jgi:mannitol-1-phosphate 5-dehydrogenase|nr:mannitol-1-phosphate 5-dehydrogenase [Spirochaetaceae bacterium]